MSANRNWQRGLLLLRLSGMVYGDCAVADAPVTPQTAPDRWWTEQRVARIRIDLPADAVASLRKDPRQKVRAAVRIDETPFSNVALHLKGSIGSFRTIDQKPSFTLAVSKNDGSANFHGASKIHLNNSVEDPTYLDEAIGTMVFARAGVPAPAVHHALVELNGRALGLFVVKEGFTREFLARHFRDSAGPIYDNDQSAVQTANEDASASPEHSLALARLISACAMEEASARWEALQKVVDRDEFISFMAGEVLLCHRDGYSVARNNFRLYHEPSSDKFVFLPHGMDQLFGRPDFPWLPNMAGMVAHAVITTPEGRLRYRERLQSLLARDFDVGALTRVIDQAALVLRAVMARKERRSFDDAITSLKNRIVARRAFLVDQLTRPEPQPLTFTNEVATLSNWKPFDPPINGSIRETPSPDQRPSLYIHASPGSAASWRTRVLLEAGVYRFEGAIRTAAVAPLFFGKNHGARLRIAGVTSDLKGLIGTQPWSDCGMEFNVVQPRQEVELICELRARSGEVWFDRGSLRLVTQKRENQKAAAR